MAKVKRIRDESEYKTGGSSDFIGLDEGEKFTGYFLGEADPKVDDPAFFPYKMHWNGKTSVPCADDECVYCEDGDRPRSKAYTLWLVTIDEAGTKLGKKGEGELRIFDMPVTVIKQFNEYRSEGEKVKGHLYRVSRTDEKTYVVVPKTQPPLKAADIKALIKSDDAPDFEAMLTNKLKKAMEGVAVARALEDDDDDKPKKSKAKSKGKEKDEEPEDNDDAGEWPDELDEEEVTVRSVGDDGAHFVAVSSSYDEEVNIYTRQDLEFDPETLSKGDVVTVTAEKDDEGDYILSAEPDVAEGDGNDDDNGNDLPDSLEDVEFEVVSTNQSEGTIDVKNDEMEFSLYLLDTVKWDEDDYPEGAKITVSAEKDRAGDMVTTDAPEVVKAKKSGGKKAAGKKGSGKKTAKAGKGK